MTHDLGWHAHWEKLCDARALERAMIGRIGTVHMDAAIVLDPAGRRLRGLFSHQLAPASGDWVVFSPIAGDYEQVLIEEILPRRTTIARKAAGKTSKWVILATNVDLVFIVTALDSDLKASRLERYLTMVWDSGARPVILCTKLDLCADPDAMMSIAEEAAPGVPLHGISAVTGEGTDAVRAYLEPGVTAVFAGSSGVGKSTLVNRLVGRELMGTGAIRAQDQRGRHTTTHRALIPLPTGGVVIDTPGLRELSPVAEAEALSKTFTDIEALAQRCRFRDCAHADEPGCAVIEAVTTGRITRRRLESFHKLRREMEHQAVRESEWKRRARDRSTQKIYREAGRIKRNRNRY